MLTRMKTLLRTLLYLALIVWLGAEIFLPIVAAAVFGALPRDQHTAGTIVGALLRTLHGMGFVCAIVLLVLLAVAPACNIYKSRMVMAPMILVVIMIALTAWSQYGIIPAMDRDQVAAGGAIDTTDTTSPTTADFNKLHNRSMLVEEAIILLGLTTVVLVAGAETARN
jgi:hypothetical protein